MGEWDSREELYCWNMCYVIKFIGDLVHIDLAEGSSVPDWLKMDEEVLDDLESYLESEFHNLMNNEMKNRLLMSMVNIIHRHNRDVDISQIYRLFKVEY
jgi:hypothetical protein